MSARAPSPRGWQGYTKVLAVGDDGRSLFVMIDPDGRFVDDAMIASRRQAHRREHYEQHGMLDEAALETIERHPDRFATTTGLVLTPATSAVATPLPSEPGANEYFGDIAAWAKYYDGLRAARLYALDALLSELPPEAVPTKVDDTTVEIVVPTSLVPLVARLPHLGGAGLRGQDMEPSEQLAALANEAVSFNTFHGASPVGFDGNGNGQYVGVGQYDFGYPALSPHHAAWHFYAAPGQCNVPGDCGNCSTYGCSCIANTCYGNHSTWTFTILGTIDDAFSPWKKIGANQSRIWFVSPDGASFETARGWWSQNDVHVASISLGSYGTRIGKDRAVREDRIALLHSSGNNAAGKACETSSPSEICVGNFSHTTFTMAGNSSSLNPDTTDRELPDIAVPGVSLSVYDPGGSWVAKSGTSLSAPMAASLVALLFDVAKTSGGPNYYPTLPNYPELAKALLMASSTADVDGLGSVSNPGGNPDEKDGAGGIQADRLFSIWAAGTWSVRTSTLNDPKTLTWKTVSLTAGQTLRAYIAWNRCPSAAFEDMSADFGVYICPPSGPCSSLDWDSYDQSSEGVEYTAGVSGNHTIELTRWYMDSCNGTTGESVGLAYVKQ